MIRSMTSNVSALSGIVANGHQTIHFVYSAFGYATLCVFGAVTSQYCECLRAEADVVDQNAQERGRSAGQKSRDG
jgi:hypothetical protein